MAQVEAQVKYALGSGTSGDLVPRRARRPALPVAHFLVQPEEASGTFHRATSAVISISSGRSSRSACSVTANRVEPVELSINRYQEPIFRGHAIGCERCHGPGELHVRRQEVVDDRDLSIVNPRHLEPSLRAAVCEQCHLMGDHRIERQGRSPFRLSTRAPLDRVLRGLRPPRERQAGTRPWDTSSR